jgi:hypothetical protein
MKTPSISSTTSPPNSVISTQVKKRWGKKKHDPVVARRRPYPAYFAEDENLPASPVSVEEEAGAVWSMGRVRMETRDIALFNTIKAHFKLQLVLSLIWCLGLTVFFIFKKRKSL